MDSGNKMNGRFFRRVGINIIFIAMALPACIVLPGCEVYDLFEKAVSSYWKQETVGILVYPPVPLSFAETGKINSFFSDWVFGKNIEDVLLGAIEDFNKSSDTDVKGWYIRTDTNDDIKRYSEFYKEMAANGRDQRQLLMEEIEKYRQGEKAGAKDISMIMVGIYDDSNPDATAYPTSLIVYDYNKYSAAQQRGVVTKQPGYVQNGDLENLVKAVLKKVLN
jgi:hypothetical protein